MIVLFRLKALLVHFIQTPTFGLSFLLLLSSFSPSFVCFLVVFVVFIVSV
jgi:hypothetical protein